MRVEKVEYKAKVPLSIGPVGGVVIPVSAGQHFLIVSYWDGDVHERSKLWLDSMIGRVCASESSEPIRLGFTTEEAIVVGEEGKVEDVMDTMPWEV